MSGPPARLTPEQRAFLSLCATMLHGPSDLDLAAATAVSAARRYRAAGASWAEIADALEVTEARLRSMRAAVTEKRTPAIELPRTASTPLAAPGKNVLFAAGCATAERLDFPGEAAALRRLLLPHGVTVVERFAVEVAELDRELRGESPAVLHIAAHSDFGAVHLSLSGQPAALLHDDLHGMLGRLPARPNLIVLNCCDTDQLARRLITAPGSAGRPGIATAIGWRGQVTDDQARTFTDQFYRHLPRPETVGKCFDDAHLTVTATWPEQAEPRLYGDASLLPLATLRC